MKLYRSLALIALIALQTLTTVAMPTNSDILHQQGLTVSVYHLAPHPVSYQDSTALTFSPTAFTLLHTATEAILIDSPATKAQGDELYAWIHSTIPGKKLKGIMVTHGHGDHFFSAPQIASQFPGAKIFVTKDVLAHMRQQYEPELYVSFWGNLFAGGQIDDSGIPDSIVDLLPDTNPAVSLGRHEVQIVPVGQGDTYNSTVIHVPSIDLVVGGDVIYGTCHQLLVEDATPELRQAWKNSVAKVEKLCAKVVVPSHMLPDEGYGPEHVAETKRYIDVWETKRAKATNWEELEGAMKGAFPGRDGSFILRWTSQAPFGADF